MRSFFRLTLLFLACGGLNGCIFAVTHGVGSAMRMAAVGENFSAWRAQMPAIPPGEGRLVVYPGGSLSAIYATTGVGLGGKEYFAVDSDVCEVLGHSFVFLDRPAGRHVVSADDVSQTFGGYQQGRNKLSVDLAAGSLVYVRVDKRSGGALARDRHFPTLAAPASAEAELRDFPIDNDGLTCQQGKAAERKPG